MKIFYGVLIGTSRHILAARRSGSLTKRLVETKYLSMYVST